MRRLLVVLALALAAPLAAQEMRVRGSGAPPAAPVNPADSAVGAIAAIGVKVGELRSVYDLYRRAAFNDPDGALVDRAEMYHGACRALAETIRTQQHWLCRDCLGRHTIAPIDQYRRYIPTLERFARSCATRVETLRARGTPQQKAKALREDVGPAGTRLVAALRPYEQRLQNVRVAMGWAAAPSPTIRR